MNFSGKKKALPKQAVVQEANKEQVRTFTYFNKFSFMLVQLS